MKNRFESPFFKPRIQRRKLMGLGFIALAMTGLLAFQNCSAPMTTYDELDSYSTGSTNAIQVLSYPVGTQIALGQSASFTVSAYSSLGLTLSYQWYKDGVLLSGATSNTLYLSSALATDTATYYLRISDGTNATVAPSFYLQVGTTTSALSITSSPSSQTVGVGSTTRFEVIATSSTGTLTYQWLKNGVSISGQTGSELYLTSTASGDSGYYAVLVSDGTNTVKSATALLTVTVTSASCAAIGGSLYNSHCYVVNRTASTWETAQATCKNSGGTLAIITSSTENYYIYTLTQTSVWIGANDKTSEGSFIWDDNTALSFSAWGAGEPNGGTSENCVEMTPYGYWNDAACSTTRSFVCEI